jgi:hypothetical protein
MKALSHRGRLVATLLTLATCTNAAAQTTRDSRGFVGIRAGLNHEQAEDGQRGTTGAGGLLAGFRFGRDWAAEAELWVPPFIHDSAGESKHRDILVSVSIVRTFGAHGVRPYLVAGLSVARTENRFTTCIADRVPPPPVGMTQTVPTIVDCSESDVRERRRQHFTGTTEYVVGGAGLEVPLWRRLRLTPEVRVHVAPTSAIVRSAVGLMVDF